MGPPLPFRIPLLVFIAGLLAAEARVTIALGQQDVDGSRFAPGTLVIIQPGEREYLRLTKLSGTPDRPITVVNGGGLVRLANRDRGYALVLSGCNDVRLTGSGAPGLTYGFSVETVKKGMFAVHVVDRSTRIEVDHVEVTGAGFAGFNVKDEPSADGSTNRGAWVMEDIHLHHNFVHDVEGEGFYVGHTFYEGIARDGGPKLLPHTIRGLVIEHNRVENSGCEGIQIGSTVSGLVVSDNVIIKPGQRPFAAYQNNGMQINGAGEALILRNTVINAPGNGIISSGLEADYAPTFAFNCVVRSGGQGIVLGGKGITARFLNNTVVASGADGIHYALKAANEGVLLNNLLVANRGGIGDVYRSGTLQQATNLVFPDLAKAGFTDPSQDHFDLVPGSPAAGRGTPLGEHPYGTDLAGRDLGRARAADVGAYAPSAPPLRAEAEEGPKRRTEPRRSVPADKPEPPATWREDLATRLQATLDRRKTVRFPCRALGGQEMRVTAFDGTQLTLDGGGMSLVSAYARLDLHDGASLAAALADLAERSDPWRAVAADLLAAAGRDTEAQRYR